MQEHWLGDAHDRRPVIEVPKAKRVPELPSDVMPSPSIEPEIPQLAAPPPDSHDPEYYKWLFKLAGID
ncbi:MAG TPA: hypothetical protein VLH84_04575 [Patescibacteria group bacterium]|nr:hypothetical protein [Patescibacteria group bacterium]